MEWEGLVKVSEDLGQKFKVKKSKVFKILKEFIAVIKASLEAGKPVTIENFGRFVPKIRKARKFYLFAKKGRIVSKPNRKTVVFKPSPGYLKELRRVQ
jgi:nucleoid DNA-binding protein